LKFETVKKTIRKGSSLIHPIISFVTMRIIYFALLALLLEARVDAFVPSPSLVAKLSVRLSSTQPTPESEFNQTPQTTISELSEAELTRQKLQLELEALQKKRKLIENQMQETNNKQAKVKTQVQRSLREREISRSELRQVTGGSSFLPLTTTLGAIALGRGALEQRRKKVEGKRLCVYITILNCIH
jgi:hypothetical protein